MAMIAAFARSVLVVLVALAIWKYLAEPALAQIKAPALASK